MPDKPKLLVIEDDPNLNQSIVGFVSDFADADAALTGTDGAFMAEQAIYDAIVLDIMLPELNGFDLLKTLRAKQVQTPVLILTAKDALADKLRGFTLGGDDYLTKPFHREELVMRLKALLKRTGKLALDNVLQCPPITLDLANHTVSVNDSAVILNGKEYDLLVYLLQNADTIITKDQIFDRLWGFDSDTAISVVEVYMSNLRKKLRQTPAENMIKTIRSVGYILQSEAINEE
ncbi:response regulator transcription factor [Lacticaseibacillus baoqingensis]|uniref:Response regulator transcription factor n=1 Tax=Lacticaseibacillus baoqingensis TaxID=2486013 RepID=A0ABW4E5C0_9LACO|nr:response regulator transcription factor [Lacticaseibacillus baoqingensis]